MKEIDPKYKVFIKNLNLEVRLNWYKKTYELARAAGISQGNLSKILNGKVTAEYDTQIKLAEAVEIDYKTLTGGDKIESTVYSDEETQEYKRFLAAAKHHDERLGTPVIAEKYECSDKYIYMLLQGHKKAGRKTQRKFAAACGFNDIQSFLNSVEIEQSTPQDHTEWKIANFARKFECKQLVCDLLERLLSLENQSTIEFAKMVGKIDDEITKLSADEIKPASEDRHVSGES